MIRSDFVEALAKAAPALSTNDMVPILTHYWFTGQRAMSFNDSLAISVPLKTDIKCALPGKLLLDLLKTSKAKEIRFDGITDNEVTVVASSAKMKLATLPPEEFRIFKMPTPDSAKALPVPAQNFLHGLELALGSVSSDAAMPDMLGITVSTDSGYLVMHATNAETLVESRVKMTNQKAKVKRAILPAAFAEQVIKLNKDADTIHIEIHADYAFYVGPEKEYVFGRLLGTDAPLDFNMHVDSHLPSSYKKNRVTIPSKLEAVLERAIITASSDKGGVPATKVTNKAEKMTLHTKTAVAETNDYVMVGDKHPPVTMMVNPKIFKTGIGKFSHMLVTDKAVVMSDETMDTVYLISPLADR